MVYVEDRGPLSKVLKSVGYRKDKLKQPVPSIDPQGNDHKTDIHQPNREDTARKPCQPIPPTGTVARCSCTTNDPKKHNASFQCFLTFFVGPNPFHRCPGGARSPYHRPPHFPFDTPTTNDPPTHPFSFFYARVTVGTYF